MRKNPTKQHLIRKKRDDTARIIAEIHAVTPAYVRMVINGDKVNDQILLDYLTYNQEKNKLIQAIKKATPYSKN